MRICVHTAAQAACQLPGHQRPPSWCAFLFALSRFGATNAQGEVDYHQVEQPQMIEACGDTARYLKPYQLVRAAGLWWDESLTVPAAQLLRCML